MHERPRGTDLLLHLLLREGAKQVRDLGLMEPWPVDYSHLTSEEVEVKSADGTLVPPGGEFS